MVSSDGVTQMLEDIGEGDSNAADLLLPLVYDELRRLAQQHLAHERPDHTLQATALVHEAYLRLVDSDSIKARSRVHFFALAAQAIRRILIDHARHTRRLKRGGLGHKIALEQSPPITVDADVDLLELDDAMRRLAEIEPRHAQIIELRFFGGMRFGEIAELLDVSQRTIMRDWRASRAWLFRALRDD